MSAAHTPGPWVPRLTPNDSDVAYEIDGVCLVLHGSEEKANAQSIAALPDVLTALRELWCASEGCSDAEISARIKARAAYVKATGETP